MSFDNRLSSLSEHRFNILNFLTRNIWYFGISIQQIWSIADISSSILITGWTILVVWYRLSLDTDKDNMLMWSQWVKINELMSQYFYQRVWIFYPLSLWMKYGWNFSCEISMTSHGNQWVWCHIGEKYHMTWQVVISTPYKQGCFIDCEIFTGLPHLGPFKIPWHFFSK